MKITRNARRLAIIAAGILSFASVALGDPEVLKVAPATQPAATPDVTLQVVPHIMKAQTRPAPPTVVDAARRWLVGNQGETLYLTDRQPAAAALPEANDAHRRAISAQAQCQSCHQAPTVRTRWLNALNAYESRDNFNLLALTFANVADDGPRIGVTVGPIDDVLRAQLGIPVGRGIVVTEVLPETPAQRAGVERHDVLLTVDGTPVPNETEFDQLIRATKPAGPPLGLRLLRRSKPVELKVTPLFPSPATQPVTTATAPAPAASEPRYRVGISLAPADETLRTQLGLGDTGLVVLEVLPNTPAERKGIRAYDVIVKAAGRPVREDRDLIESVQAAKFDELTLELLRAGQPQTVAVAPEKAPPPPALTNATSIDVNRPRELLILPQAYEAHYELLAARAALDAQAAATAARAPAQSAAEELNRVAAELDQLNKALTALRDRLEAERGKGSQAKPE